MKHCNNIVRDRDRDREKLLGVLKSTSCTLPFEECPLTRTRGLTETTLQQLLQEKEIERAAHIKYKVSTLRINS